jgi:maleate isomerase
LASLPTIEYSESCGFLLLQEEKKMYGWRARLGVLVPSGIVVTEPEFSRMTPKGVSCHFHRIAFRGEGSESEVLETLRRVEQSVGDATEMICHVRPAVVALTGTGVSFIGGYGYDQKIIRQIKEKSGGLPATTTSSSVIDALIKLGVKKISMATPYLEPVARIGMKFVEDSGIRVLEMKWLGKAGFDIAEVSSETLYNLVKAVDRPESEAIFISCTTLHTIELIKYLEEDLRKPVITSNQATLWNMLRLAGVNEKIEGFGQLLEKY